MPKKLAHTFASSKTQTHSPLSLQLKLSIEILPSISSPFASLAFGVQESEFKVYEQILNQLDTKQIPAFVVQTAKPNLPSRVDEMITLKDVSSDGLNIHGEFVLNETKTKKLKSYNKAQISALKDEFYQNGKEALCNSGMARAALNRGITLSGSYGFEGRHLFDLKLDKSSCE